MVDHREKGTPILYQSSFQKPVRQTIIQRRLQQRESSFLKSVRNQITQRGLQQCWVVKRSHGSTAKKAVEAAAMTRHKRLSFKSEACLLRIAA